MRLRNFQSRRGSKGFTITEILLVLGLLAVVVGISMPIIFAFVVKNDLDLATAATAQSLRRAQALAATGSGDSDWGAHVDGQSITVFKGDSFGGRDASADEVFSLPLKLAPSGLTDVTFSKTSGLPQIFGTITLTDSYGGSETVGINNLGLVSY